MPHKDLSKKLTVQAIKPPREGRVDFFDTSLPGFGLRVNSKGVKSWFVFYRVPAGPDKGKQRRFTLEPRYPALGCKDAREKAGGIFSEVAGGGDPAAKRQAEKAAPAPAKPKYETFQQVVDGFIELYAKPRQRTWNETKRTLEKNCADWLDRPIASITKAESYDLLDGFVAAGHGPKARVTLAWLRTLFRWAAKRDIIGSSVMEAVDIDFEKRTRDRHYTDEEIKSVWSGADKLGTIEQAFVKLSVLLATRKSELAGMRRSEFDDRERPTVWTVPHERTKTKKTRQRERTYVTPLPPLAQRIIKGLPQLDDDLVFPGRHRGKPMVPGSTLQKKIQQASGIEDWTFHACRDTVATWLQEQGHSEYERGLVLNHAESTVTSQYSHGYPIELKHQLLDKWADHVTKLVAPEGVEPLFG